MEVKKVKLFLHDISLVQTNMGHAKKEIHGTNFALLKQYSEHLKHGETDTLGSIGPKLSYSHSVCEFFRNRK